MLPTRPWPGRCRVGLAAVVLLEFFIDVHIFVRHDLSGKMTVRYPATPISNEATERFRFASDNAEPTRIVISGGVAAVRVQFHDVTKLSDSNEMKETPIEIGPAADGVRKMSARLRTAFINSIDQSKVTFESSRAATVQVTLPGTVVQTNGDVTSRRTVQWSAPIRQYFRPEGIEIEATYRTRGERATESATARSLPDA